MNKIKIVDGHKLYIDGRRIYPDKSLKIINHSPDGFSFGYGGSGCAQSALAILLEFADKQTAADLHQQFKWDHVSKWQDPNMEIELNIGEWIKEHYDPKNI